MNHSHKGWTVSGCFDH